MTKDDVEMITREDVNKLESFNLPMLKEALRQTELRVKYNIETKNRLEIKAFSLLTFFFTNLIGGTISLFSKGTATFEYKIHFFLLIALFLISTYSCIQLYKSLKSSITGIIGMTPDAWLYSAERIENCCPKKQNYYEGRSLAFILIDYKDSIKKAEESIKKNVKHIDNTLRCFVIWFLIFTLVSGNSYFKSFLSIFS